MHSDTVEKSASPRKRIVSRAMSEEESLRHIIEVHIIELKILDWLTFKTDSLNSKHILKSFVKSVKKKMVG